MDSFLNSATGSQTYEMGAGQSTSGAGGGSPFRPPPFAWGGPYPGQMRQQQQQQQQQGTPPETARPPPASRRAVRQLPTVVVTPEDLVDENNRECCICLEENHLKDRVIRLPCAHIYHCKCITDWLYKSCTCPVCRYELPTDDPRYEKSRRERMAGRKPRYARYELDRLGPRELRDLARRTRVSLPGGNGMGMEKGELVGCIVDSGRIEIIAAPEPVEHRLSDLRAMGVGRLKRAMADAGVFFDPVDVVEKDDMVRIFVASGRVVLLPEEETEEDDGEVEGKDDEPTEEEEDRGASMDMGAEDKAGLDEVTVENGAAENGAAENAVTEGGTDSIDGEGEQEGIEANVDEKGGNVTSSDMDAKAVEDEDGAGENVDTENGHDMTDGEIADGDIQVGSHASSTSTIDEEDETTSMPERLSAEDQQHQGERSAFSSRTVSQLRALAREVNVDISDCIEKREMVDRLADRVSCSRSS